MPSKVDDLAAEPPTDINPYEALGLDISAGADDIKKTYKKLALKHHPDKVAPQNRAAAHARFQEIAFAYAILSDERRRKRYDLSGNTAESLDLEDDEFSWSDFYREQWADAVTGESLNALKSSYQGSDEEKRDVLRAYKSSKGNMNALFRTVMLSNPLADEERFRQYVDQAIANGEVKAYEAYTNESTRKRERRHENARQEGKEAEGYAKKLGVYDQLFEGKPGKKRTGKVEDESGLAALIQQKSKGRAATFLDNLEAKYASGAKSTKKGKKRLDDEPPEEAFETTASRAKKRKADGNRAKGDEGDQELDEKDKSEELVDNTKPAKKRSIRA
ncbi:DnaJ domain, conserved site [Lasallia pustulata]|uniref:DnaJ domain, conserved site n=1 Tax=Lasallia pustulata TaxID=136370 RepID=A0A1W5D184_9LECA|nr:DnaJ domain, conserved site [Lasallia pustulata]